MVERKSSSKIGTEQWLRDTGGKLTFPQAVFLSAQGLAQSAGDRFASRPVTRDFAAQAARVSIARAELLKVLDTQRERVLERQGEGLLNHACRTYLLGAALLPDELFVEVDQTAAVVAALTHDDGLVHPSTPGNCFSADSAIEADEMMFRLCKSSDLGAGHVARTAVIAHFQPRLPKGASAEAQLVASGASADVMGFGLRRIDPELGKELWQEWPDIGFLSDVRHLLKGERTRAPWTRPGVLSWSGMPYLLRSSR